MQRDAALDLAGHDHLRCQRVYGYHAELFQNQNIDGGGRELIEIRQPNFGSVIARRRYEAALGQPALQRHLSALETGLVIAAGARHLPLVTEARGLAGSTADAAAD